MISKIYYADFLVKSIDINPKKQIILRRLFQYFQETAGQQLSKNKMSVDYLSKDNLSWVISRFAIEIKDIPVWKDKVRVHTWVSSFDGQTCIREYQIINKKTKKIMVKATARWVIIDLATRKRVAYKVQTKNIKTINKRALSNDLAKLSAPEEINCASEFTVRYSEIDFNMHVNNTRYPMWILDTLGMSFLDMHDLGFIEINYISELFYGDDIKVASYRGKDIDDKHCLAHKMINTNTGKLSCLARTLWKSDDKHHVSEDKVPHIINPKIR